MAGPASDRGPPAGPPTGFVTAGPAVLRIVAGQLGGRRISAPAGRGTRPTREMVREAWFSALGDAVAGARAVDLFAGSGALGIEALSRGAASVDFVESDRRAAAVIRENLDEMGVAGRSRLVRRDVGAFLDDALDEPYDLALADPPYGSDWPGRLAACLASRPFARLLCVEHAPGALEGTAGLVWQREYGDSALSFLRPTTGAGGEGTTGSGEEST